MKKFLAVILAMAMLAPAACFGEKIDLSAYSFAELAALRDRIQMEMMARDEWQEVTVPGGVWEVGVDIPAGTWLVKCAPSRNDYLLRKCEISWGRGRPLDGYWDWPNEKGQAALYCPDYKDYKGQTTEYVVTVEVGDFIYIDQFYNDAVFTPYTGKPSFVFK